MQYSIVNFSELKKTPDFRIDAEYYHPVFLQNGKLLKRLVCIKLNKISSIQFGTTPSGANFKDDGIPFVRSQDFVNGYIDTENIVYISSEEHLEQIKSDLQKNDILIAAVGATIGAIGLCTISEGNFNQNAARIRLKGEHSPKVFPEFLFAFLKGRFGQYQLGKLNTGNAQSYLNTSNLSSLIIGILRQTFQEAISKIVKKSFIKIEQAQHSYKQAEGILLDEMGLVDWRAKHCLSFVRNYSDTQQAGRMDADYFQPKYEEIIHAIQSYPGGYNTLGNLCATQKCVEVGSGEYLDDGVPFVRVSNLSPFEITEEKYISSMLYNALQKHYPQRGEILLTKDATPGMAYYLREQPPKMILSSGILRLKRKTDKINDNYLMLALNSILTRQQVARDVGGSVILHWRPEQVKRTVIPILAEDKQIEIQQRVAEAFALRRRSKHLLECAKRAVELAIEKDEQTAMDWLKSQEEKEEITGNSHLTANSTDSKENLI